MNDKNRRLVVISNRLPLAVSREEGEWRIRKSAGGLVSALQPVVKDHHGLWIGWPGCGDEAPCRALLDDFSGREGFSLEGVPLSEEEVERFYWGFSNESLWPLFHDLLGYCRFDIENWRSYVEVNGHFAETVAKAAQKDDLIWVQDYQLILVGQALRNLGFAQNLAFFQHIPFPSLDLFWRLPWKDEILRGLLAYDLIGFQTSRDRRNFVHCVVTLVPGAEVLQRRRHITLLKVGERLVTVGHFPISIDYNEYNNLAQSPEVVAEAKSLRSKYGDHKLVLGLDRLDYTKGVPERFLAFERALEKYPELQQRITLLQVVVPSRSLIPDYRNLKGMVEQMAGRINGRFAVPGWTPIQYYFRHLTQTQLLAHYLSAEIGLVTPLRDGMNLVSKEYCAANVNLNGVLILSEFAGAAEQLGSSALLVNPYDIDGTADAISYAYGMSAEEKRHRMLRLRIAISRNNVHRWARNFLEEMKSPR
ncbi:MAG: trehalose-6-phosphate synthase [Deltaproteobacteria bacterium]|nr:trehalose-6-phosphate synthase [Deltaproteobacteria bacterium]